MLNYIIYRIGQVIALAFPLSAGYKIAEFVSDFHSICSRKDRHAVEANLKVVFPEKSLTEIRKIRRRMSRGFARYLIDFFRFDRIDKEFLEKNTRIEGREHFDQALAKGRGGIILSAHMGNWELGAVITALLGYPLYVVALRHKDKKVDKFFNSQRENKGVKVIPIDKAGRSCIDILKENKFLALVGDRDFNEKGLLLNFFGKPALFPKGPAVFALKTGASIIPAFVINNRDGSHTFKIEKALEFEPTGNKNEDIVKIMSSYKQIFEYYIRKYPEQWYMFRRFWKE